MVSAAPAIVVLGPSGLAAARRVKAALRGAVLHGYASRVSEVDRTFADAAAHLRALFERGVPIVGICAAGVLIRALAPALSDKRKEPPVVAVAEDGSVAVPLLGGHHGANDIARTIAQALGGVAAVTTAGDLRFGAALDAPPSGFRLANPDAAKPVMAGLLAGAAVRLDIETADQDCGWFRDLPQSPKAAHSIRVTDRSVPIDYGTLLYHPATIVVGVGCERGAPAEDLIALVQGALANAGLTPASVACVASIALKAAEPAVHALAASLGVPARFFDATTLEAETPRLANPSDLVFHETGCHGVAEGAALAAVGPAGTLAVPKIRGRRVTCAIARSPRLIDPEKVGRARGTLCIVGLGPGEAGGRTADAAAALSAATDLVGYRLYLDLAGPLQAGQRRHDFALGEEEARVGAALALAGEGRRVALVSSGDPGIYAMAALVFELIERAAGTPEGEAWQRLEIVGVPGVSAMQAAAARIGAPLGHDFCAVSLSDLLTPWAVIEQRLRAAAAGDFVVALYNPVSRRRQDQLARARAILLAERAPQTPVVLARNLGRPEESVSVTTLEALAPEQVDMLTVVLVGSSATRAVERPDGGRWVYTPRGYAAKAALAESGAADRRGKA
jgi:cobalt-precorrin 5A hydrolase / precorrin-3B C17-methyltransferase